jgi:hypothetical protein
VAQWGKIFKEGGRKIGVSFTVYEDGIQMSAMKAAGFVDLQVKDLKVSNHYVDAWTYMTKKLISAADAHRKLAGRPKP